MKGVEINQVNKDKEYVQSTKEDIVEWREEGAPYPSKEFMGKLLSNADDIKRRILYLKNFLVSIWEFENYVEMIKPTIDDRYITPPPYDERIRDIKAEINRLKSLLREEQQKKSL